METRDKTVKGFHRLEALVGAAKLGTRFDFAHKGVIVTGGARGIGFEIARQFLGCGAHVGIWDFSEASLALAAESLANFGERAHFQRVDVSNPESCENAARELPFELDILVNNAGITRDKTFAKMSTEDFDQVIATNLSGVFHVTKALSPRFKVDSASKRIINLASVVAANGNFGQTNYVAAKAGVVGMTKTWAREWGRKGFTVNAIAPGFTRTAMVEAMPGAAREAIANEIPVGRLGEPRDIAYACLFLSSEEASYINGTVLAVDGGLVV